MSVTVELQNGCAGARVPQRRQFRDWAEAALTAAASGRDQTQLSIRIVDREESAMLNEHYRHKQGPTNILSFPLSDDLDGLLPLLGDLAICAPVVQQEAAEQAKPEQAHWAHLTVHGVLHLLGFDHQEEQQAEAMEAMEIKILQQLGIANPYIAS